MVALLWMVVAIAVDEWWVIALIAVWGLACGNTLAFLGAFQMCEFLSAGIANPIAKRSRHSSPS